jgi:hypothetical protein
MAERLVGGGVDRWVRGQTNASDHAPVWIELDIWRTIQWLDANSTAIRWSKKLGNPRWENLGSFVDSGLLSVTFCDWRCKRVETKKTSNTSENNRLARGLDGERGRNRTFNLLIKSKEQV